MKLIGLEEHFVTPEVRAAWDGLDGENRDDMAKLMDNGETLARLLDMADARLKDMDAVGLDVQVLSLNSPGVQNLEAAQAVALARAGNDLLAGVIAAHPDRLQAFAALPTPDPAQAVQEMERCMGIPGFKGAMINGRTRDRSLDHPDFLPILEAASRLRVPIYIHPQIPVHAVRNAYYEGFDDKLSVFFATAGIGWHYETGIQALRLILAGVFDRFPDLQIILGHWGELIVSYLERINGMSKFAPNLHRPIEDYVKQNFYVTPSGMFSPSYLRQAVEVMGVDRIMFSTDYPFMFAPEGGARKFLANAVLSEPDKEKIAHGNWERLTGRA